MRAALITISTSKSAGNGKDESGDRLVALAEHLGLQLAGRDLIPDDQAQIEQRLRHWTDVERCELVLTSGGTGVAASDLTPEATRAVIEREIPGISEAMREASREHTPHWMLSRALAGTRRASLIINFPGSPDSITQTGSGISQAITHALALIAGQRTDH
ncbi:MAG TPA: MogA/MoaB family molybdenum cofactor biosynthesis protein [Solirubrobacteraceae bacterium]|nr:MogA/MoaB family molybdenum cofactor biosynthesis protein [Solirubrobacteraceae bacterium]